MSVAVPTADLRLREVSGPSAFGGELARFRDLLWLLSVTEFRTQYANTALGFLWTIVRPLVFFGVIFLVLREILDFGRNIKDYGLILVLGLILFTFFQDATSRAVRSISGRESMVRKMRFPRIILPLSVSLTAAFSLLLNLLAVLPLLLLFGLEPRLSWLLFVPLLAALVLFTTALAMILSVLFVRLEDTAQAWGLVSRILFYASPVLYPIEIPPEALQKVIAASPLALILEQMRVWVIDPGAPNAVDAGGALFGLAIPLALLIGTCALALWLFVRDAPRVAEEL